MVVDQRLSATLTVHHQMANALVSPLFLLSLFSPAGLINDLGLASQRKTEKKEGIPFLLFFFGFARTKIESYVRRLLKKRALRAREKVRVSHPPAFPRPHAGDSHVVSSYSFSLIFWINHGILGD